MTTVYTGSRPALTSKPLALAEELGTITYSEIVRRTPRGIYTKRGLFLNNNLSLDDWGEEAQDVVIACKAALWYLGDVLVYGEDHFGEDFSAFVSDYAPQTQANAMSLSRRFPPNTRLRSGHLTWTHYQTVAPLPDKEAYELLLTADLERWNTSDIRNRVRALKAPTPEVSSPQGDLVTPKAAVVVTTLASSTNGAVVGEVVPAPVITNETLIETIRLLRMALEGFQRGDQHFVNCNHGMRSAREGRVLDTRHDPVACGLSGCDLLGAPCTVACLTARAALTASGQYRAET